MFDTRSALLASVVVLLAPGCSLILGYPDRIEPTDAETDQDAEDPTVDEAGDPIDDGIEDPTEDEVEDTEAEEEAECGNGVLETGEDCDDGYTDACGTCNADCSGAGSGSTCGDGEECEETEACDDGFTDACGTCNADCSASGTGSTCGDGEVCDETEICDDSNTTDCDGCRGDCLAHEPTGGGTWRLISTAGAPAGTVNNPAVWTGSEMIVWGGMTCGTSSCAVNTGGRYDPVADTWSLIPTSGAPVARNSHMGVWTGSLAIMFGGHDTSGGSLASGGRYDPVADTWSSTSGTGAPTSCSNSRATWSGSAGGTWWGS